MCYPGGGVVLVRGEEPQRLVLVLRVHRHQAHRGHNASVLSPLELRGVEALHLDSDAEGGGGGLEQVGALSGLQETQGLSPGTQLYSLRSLNYPRNKS